MTMNCEEIRALMEARYETGVLTVAELLEVIDVFCDPNEDELGRAAKIEAGMTLVKMVGDGRISVVEPAIVWDGTARALDDIEQALPLGVTTNVGLRCNFEYDEDPDYLVDEPLELRQYKVETGENGRRFCATFGPYQQLGVVERGCRVRPEGDSFAVLPPGDGNDPQ